MVITVIGFILIAVLMFVLVRGKTTPIVAFILLPTIAAFIAGYNLDEVGGFIKSGLSSMLTTASLFAFSITFFSIMSDVGLFDPLINALTKRAKDSVFIVLLCVCATTFVAHLDGSGATTFLVVVPAFLPICKKVGIRAEALLCTMCGCYAVNNLLPWGGPTMRAASVIEQDVGALYRYIMPSLAIILVLAVVLAWIVSRIEVRNGAGNMEDQPINVSEPEISEKKSHGALFWINGLLTILAFIALFTEILPTNICFMIASAIALLINFPDTKEQTSRLKSYAGQAMVMVMTLFAVGVFLGIMNNGGFIEAMATWLISLIPTALAPHAHWFLALFSVPMIMMLSTDAFYYVLLPIVLGVVIPYGADPTAIAATFLVTATFGTAISPGVAAVYVGLGLADVDIGTHIKYSFKILWPLSIMCLILSTLIGVIKF